MKSIRILSAVVAALVLVLSAGCSSTGNMASSDQPASGSSGGSGGSGGY